MVIEYKSKQKHILFQLFLKVIKLLMSLNLRSKSFHNFVAREFESPLPIADIPRHSHDVETLFLQILKVYKYIAYCWVSTFV